MIIAIELEIVPSAVNLPCGILKKYVDKDFLSVRPFIALMELLTILSDVKLAHAILRKDMFEDI